MPYKDPDKRKAYAKAYGKQHYENNRDAYIQKAARNKRMHKSKWEAYKRTLSCERCGYNENPRALEFHHLHDKSNNVSTLIGQGRFKAAYEEAEKCMVLCANCHRSAHTEDDETS